MKKQTRMLVLVLCVPAVLFVALLVGAIQNSATYYYTIEELADFADHSRSLRVKGRLVADSVVYNAAGPYLEFRLEEGGHQILARGTQAMPDNFVHSEEVIIEGRLDEANVFQVSKMMLQCPSKYEAEIESQL